MLVTEVILPRAMPTVETPMTTLSITSLVGLCVTRCSLVTHPELLFRLRFAVFVFPAPVVSILSRFHGDRFFKFSQSRRPLSIPDALPPRPLPEFLFVISQILFVIPLSV
jgi:hypothetical protein